MYPKPLPKSGAARWLIWWLIWTGILAWLVAIWFIATQGPFREVPGRTAAIDAVGIVLLLASCLARWLVLPRVHRVQSAFVLFGTGLALAEACGLMGVFMSAHRSELFVLGALGIVQWVPFFARRYITPSAGVPLAPGG